MFPRPLISVKDLCWLLYLYPGRLVAHYFPGLLPAMQPFGAIIARGLARDARKRLSKRLHIAGYSDVEIASIVERYLDRAVGRALSDLDLERMTHRLSSSQVDVEGLEYLENARDSGRGTLLVSGHFFSSRLAKNWLRNRGFPILSVRHPVPPDPGIGRLGELWLQRRYIDFLKKSIGDEVMIDDPECTLKILRRLRSGGVVNIHIDAPFSTRSRPIQFLGKEQSFSSSFLRLAELSGASVIPFWFSGDHRCLRIVFGSPLVSISETNENFQLVIRKLEEQILERPSDYELWIML